VSMVAAPLTSEADCLDRQHRRLSGAASHLNLTRSAYRASGLVLRLDPVIRDRQAERQLPQITRRSKNTASIDR